jgi:HK97 family phage portal protein
MNKIQQMLYKAAFGVSYSQYPATYDNYQGFRWDTGYETAKYNDWSTEHAIQNGYKAQTTVFACVNKIGKALPSVPLKAYKKERDAKNRITWVEQPESPLQQLVDRPNPFFGQRELLELLSAHIQLGGNGILRKVRGGTSRNAPLELWLLMPDRVTPKTSRRKFLSHYEYAMPGGQPDQLDIQDVIHIKNPDPSNPYWGMGVLQAAAKDVDTAMEARDWNKAMLQNRAIVPSIVGFKRKFSEEGFKRLKAGVEERRLGGGKAGQEIFIDDAEGLSVHKLGLTPEEMSWLEGQRFTREDIAAAFGVPLPLLYMYDIANYKVSESRRVFWVDTIIPYAHFIEDILNRTLTPEFGDPAEIGLYFDMTLAEALQENYSEKVNNAEKLVKMGFSLPGVNRLLDLGFDEGEMLPFSPVALPYVSGISDTVVNDGRLLNSQLLSHLERKLADTIRTGSDLTPLVHAIGTAFVEEGIEAGKKAQALAKELTTIMEQQLLVESKEEAQNRWAETLPTQILSVLGGQHGVRQAG